jgi:hypothetical protein
MFLKELGTQDNLIKIARISIAQDSNQRLKSSCYNVLTADPSEIVPQFLKVKPEYAD